MLVRTLVLAIVLILLGGCTSSATAEPYELNETVTRLKSEGRDVEIVMHLEGKTYWVPLMDVTRTRLKHFVVEAWELDDGKRANLLSKVDFVGLPETDPKSYPNFLGATSKLTFWTNRNGYFITNVRTGEVARVVCSREFVMFGNWKAVGDDAIQRTTGDGVFLLGSAGVKRLE